MLVLLAFALSVGTISLVGVATPAARDLSAAGAAHAPGHFVPMLGDPASVEIEPTAAYPGALVNFSGTGFGNESAVNITFADQVITCGDSTTNVSNSSGAFWCHFPVPLAFPAGAYPVFANESTNMSFADFTIKNATLTLSPDSEYVSNTTKATGVGYSPSTALTLKVDTKTVSSCKSGSLTTDASGDLDCKFTIPVVPAGAATVSADDSVHNATTAFTVNAPTLLLTPTSGQIGSSVEATGQGYARSKVLDLKFGTVSIKQCTAGSNETNSSTGFFDCTFTVPGILAGSVVVNASDGTNHALADFTVGEPTLSIAPTTGYVASAVTATGSGFAPDTVLTVAFDAVPITQCADATSNKTSSSGDYDCDFSVPAVPAGTQTLAAADKNNSASATFLVESPTLNVAPSEGTVGSTTTVSGTGFGPGRTIALTFSGAGIAACSSGSLTVNSTGGFRCSFTVPEVPGGAEAIGAGDGINGATGSFDVEASLGLSPVSGPVGSTVTANATGFAAQSAFAIEWNGTTPVCSGTTATNGSLSCPFLAPVVPAGPATVSATVGAFSATATFTIVPGVSIVPNSGPVGSSVSVEGGGFAANAAFSVTWNTTVTLCGGEVSDIGIITCVATIPYAPAGPYVVSVTDHTHTAVTSFAITPAVALSASSGVSGATVNVAGTGFDADQAISLLWDSEVLLCSGTTNGSGGFGCTFVVPESIGGDHTITAVEGAYAPSATFVVSSDLILIPSSGSVGTSVTGAGTGFAAGTSYSVSWSSGAVVCAGVTNSFGGFSCAFTVPATPAGPAGVLAGSGTDEAGTNFDIQPSLGLSLTSGVVGATVVATGAGFAANVAVNVSWGLGPVLCANLTSAVGGFSCTFTTPAAVADVYGIVAAEGGLSASASFSLIPGAALSPGSGAAGALAQLSGSGFDADQTYTVSWNASKVLCSGTTSATGAFACSFVVPGGAPAGVHPVTIAEGNHTLTVEFTVTGSTVPPPASTGSFPWWIVVVAAVVIGLLFVLLMVFDRRRRGTRPSRAASRARPVAPWEEAAPAAGVHPSGPTASAPPAPRGPADGFSRPAPSAPAPPPPVEPPVEDIDAQMARLQRMSERMFKKKPHELGDTQNPEVPTDEP